MHSVQEHRVISSFWRWRPVLEAQVQAMQSRWASSRADPSAALWRPRNLRDHQSKVQVAQKDETRHREPPQSGQILQNHPEHRPERLLPELARKWTILERRLLVPAARPRLYVAMSLHLPSWRGRGSRFFATESRKALKTDIPQASGAFSRPIWRRFEQFQSLHPRVVLRTAEREDEGRGSQIGEQCWELWGPERASGRQADPGSDEERFGGLEHAISWRQTEEASGLDDVRREIENGWGHLLQTIAYQIIKIGNKSREMKNGKAQSAIWFRSN